MLSVTWTLVLPSRESGSYGHWEVWATRAPDVVLMSPLSRIRSDLSGSDRVSEFEGVTDVFEEEES